MKNIILVALVLLSIALLMPLVTAQADCFFYFGYMPFNGDLIAASLTCPLYSGWVTITIDGQDVGAFNVPDAPIGETVVIASVPSGMEFCELVVTGDYTYTYHNPACPPPSVDPPPTLTTHRPMQSLRAAGPVIIETFRRRH